MTKTKNKKQGFSLLEVVIVVLLISISIGFSVLYYQSSQIRADINAQASELVEYLRLQQSNAEAGLNGTAHGVHLDEDGYTLFTGTAYDEGDNGNREIQLPDTIRIININLEGGENDVIFYTPDGETQNYGTFDLYSDRIKKTKTIEVTQSGTINY